MQHKINILRAILIILLIVTFYVIFGFSSQDGEKSSSLSKEITVEVTKNIQSIQKLEKSKKEEVLSEIEHIIRKLAHFSLYTLVGILLMSLMSTYKLTNIKRIGISMGLGVLYAISDEIHQYFIPERTALIGDIFIDSSGVVVGICIIIAGMKIYNAIINKKR